MKVQDSPSVRLHLGCGEVYLPGYVNIDFPPTERTTQTGARADVHADVTRLGYAAESVAEIRLHHVFEHFSRGTALRLLIDWYDWLVVGGVLTIETPDFARSAREFLDGSDHRRRAVVLRHLFGSHEAEWAVHRDGWYREKFERVFGALGFRDLTFAFAEWHGTFNITVSAFKREPLVERADRVRAAKSLLGESLVDQSVSERRLLSVWLAELGVERSS